MKKVLLVLMILVLAAAMVACSDLVTPDTLAPVTTKSPNVTEPIEDDLTTSADVTTAPVIEYDDSSKYHLTNIAQENYVDEKGFVYDIYENGAALVGYNGSDAEIEIPASVLGSAVTLIDDYAFKGNLNIKNITIPEGVLRIGNGAFYRCRKLETLNIPASVTALGNSVFAQCTALAEMNVPENVTELGERVFVNCESLESVSLPANIKAIPAGTFYHCPSLKSFSFGADVTEIGAKAFAYCISLESVELPSALTAIGANAFEQCILIDEVIIPEGVEIIPDYAFAGCVNVTSLTLGNVNAIGSFAFRGCNSLENVTLPESVSSIGTGCFTGCERLEEITIPVAVKEISAILFKNCTNLKKINFALDITAINNGAFAGTGITEICIPEYVTTLGTGIFADCTELKTVTFGSKGSENAVALTTIGNNMFENCASLEGIKLPSSITAIGKNAFSGCESLDEINLPSELISIGEGAFLNCTKLTKVSLPDSVKTVGTYAFGIYDKVEINEATGKEAIVKTPIEGFAIVGFTNSFAHSYAVTNELAFESIGITGYIPYTELVYKEITDPETGKVSYMITGYKGNSEKISFPPYFDEGGRDNIYFTAIADGIFKDNKNIKEVIIPSSFTYIGESAFEGCSNITTLKLPSTENKIVFGKRAFAGVMASEIVLPAGLAEIPEELFMGCSKLTKLTIPEGCVSIGKGAFEGINTIKITLPESVEEIGEGAFKGIENLDEISVNFIGGSADDDNGFTYIFGGEIPEKLTVINISDKVTEIPAGTFENFASLDKVVLGQGITLIGDRAFAGCTNLTVVELKGEAPVIAQGATSIFEGAPKDVYFKYMSTYKKTYDANVEKVNGYSYWYGYRATGSVNGYFYNETDENGLNIRLTYNGKLTIAGEGKFPGSLTQPWLEYKDSIVQVTINDITEIEAGAFAELKNLESVIISASVTTIGDKAFANLPALTTVDIRGGTEGKTIAENAFENTPYAESLVTPEVPDETVEG